ncbi:MAG TPA: hypothetical protein VFV75_21275 [Candidatus Polarisedimenticolaceae bacterium]|nr:hypothetical protein [Candidatus Polarisedimenticolaceae bacterium]
MRHRTPLAATSIMVAAILSAAPARAAYRDALGGPGLVYQLRASTERLHESADRDLRERGPRGHAMAGTLHRMDQWAGYYVKAVERHGFQSRMARQRFDRFLTEYHAACGFLDGGGPRREVAALHHTVDRLSRAYGYEVAWQRDRGDRERSRRARW